MALSDDDIVTVAAQGLGAAAMMVPGPAGIALGALAEVVIPVYEAIKGGGQSADVVAAIKKSIVAAADAEMKAELGP